MQLIFSVVSVKTGINSDVVIPSQTLESLLSDLSRLLFTCEVTAWHCMSSLLALLSALEEMHP